MPELEYSKIPVLSAARVHAQKGVMAGGSKANYSSVQKRLNPSESLSEIDLLLLADAQTSGGLLAAVDPEKVDDLLSELHEVGVADAVQIGRLVEGEDCRIQIHP